jgi:hypothetical protein
MRLFVVDERVHIWVVCLPNCRPLDASPPNSGATFYISDQSRDVSRIEEAAKQPARRDKSAVRRVHRYAEHGEGHGEELDVYQHLQCGREEVGNARAVSYSQQAYATRNDARAW